MDSMLTRVSVKYVPIKECYVLSHTHVLQWARLAGASRPFISYHLCIRPMDSVLGISIPA